MAALRQRTALGRLVLVGERADECARAAELALDVARRDEPVGEFVPLLGGRAYFKGEPLRGWARARWTAKHALLRRPLPRVRELHNLRWLRARSFMAPRPVCAGVLSRGGAPCFQFLLTEEVCGVETLELFLGDARCDAGLRAGVLDELAFEIARMHALGFVHHDLYPRNILVARAAPHSRVYFIDAWAGGPQPQLRGAAYDLGCLLLDVPATLTTSEVERFFELYCAERPGQERPVDRDGLVRRVRRERRRLVERLRARPRERRGRGLPELDW